jgi:hypothetical protein
VPSAASVPSRPTIGASGKKPESNSLSETWRVLLAGPTGVMAGRRSLVGGVLLSGDTGATTWSFST